MEKTKNNKPYLYYSACNQKRLSGFQELTGNHRHALVLDQFAFWSINSILVHPDESNPSGWFCISYEDIAQRVGYSLRSIKNIITNFISKDLIEKSVKKFSTETRAWLKLTPKSLMAAGIKIETVNNTESSEKVIHNNSSEQALEKTPSSILTQNCTLRSAESALAYIEDKEEKKEKDNIITPLQGDKKNQSKLYNLPESIARLFAEIGERLSLEHKASIYGAICNLDKQHNKNLKHSTEFVAWVVFAILNSSFQLKNTKTFEHKLNSIMKLARAGKFNRPIGFHTQWDIGKGFKAKEIIKAKKIKDQKQSEINQELSTGQGGIFTLGNDFDAPHEFKAVRKAFIIEKELCLLKQQETQTMLALKDEHQRFKLFIAGNENQNLPSFANQKQQFDKKAIELTAKADNIFAKIIILEEELALAKQTHEFQGESLNALYETNAA